MTGKLILASAIIGGCGCCGFLQAARYAERANAIAGFVQAAERLRIEMNYRREDLPSLLLRIGGRKTYAERFFRRVGELYGESPLASFSECWTKGFEEVYTMKSLLPEDRRIMTELGAQLGSCGIDGQKHIVELAIAQLAALLQTAEEERKTKGRMFLGLGFTTGIMIVIVLI